MNSQIETISALDGNLINTYSYNKRNWISELNSSKDIFNYKNSYFKNGNVKTQQLTGEYNNGFAVTDDVEFTYTYDKSNRLLKSMSNIDGGKDYELENTYDKDGNLLTLTRRDTSTSYTDNFTYVYNSGTNKLKRVTGSQTQFRYDGNGNMIKDSLNGNTNILYDYRNLIIQLRQKFTPNGQISPNDSSVYVTYYYYDEAGNRIRKKVYKYIGISIPNEEDGPISEDSLSDLPSVWTLYNDEVYSRGVDGKELCIYINEDVEQWNVWGNDNEGKIIQDGTALYYFKDHLGSIRAIADAGSQVIFSQDYDAWGKTLQGRTYEGDTSIYKFTSKERDKENSYDYFGARYYDARVGRWGQIEPMLERYASISPYIYSLSNPLILFDPNGKDVKAKSSDAQQMIVNTLPLEIQRNIKFNTEGSIDRTSINSINSTSGNFEALKQLVNDSRLFEVSIATGFTYANENGEVLNEEFGSIEIDNSTELSPFGPQTGETGFEGATLVPGSSSETFNSPNNSIHIIINDALSTRGRANIFSHEAYGHAFLYSLGMDYSHKVVNVNGEFIETNAELSKQIIRSIKETEKNRRDK